MNKEIIKKYEDIKDGVAQLSNQLADITSMANTEMREYGEDIADEVSTNVKKAGEIVKENPWTTVAVVSLTALVIGLLFGHSRKGK